MDFALSKELEMLRKAVREFMTKKVAPCSKGSADLESEP